MSYPLHLADWTFFGIVVSEFFKYTYVDFYFINDKYTDTGHKKKTSTSFKGRFTDIEDAQTNFGCRQVDTVCLLGMTGFMFSLDIYAEAISETDFDGLYAIGKYSIDQTLDASCTVGSCSLCLANANVATVGTAGVCIGE